MELHCGICHDYCHLLGREVTDLRNIDPLGPIACTAFPCAERGMEDMFVLAHYASAAGIHVDRNDIQRRAHRYHSDCSIRGTVRD